MATHAGAADMLPLPSAQEFALPLRSSAMVYEDRTGTLDFDQVRKLADENPDFFHPAESRMRTNTHPHSAWWLSIAMTNTTGAARRLVLVAGAPHLENVDFYLRQGNEIRHARAGTLVPILQQADLGRFPILPFVMAPGETVSVWVKIKSHSPSALNPVLYTSRLYSAAVTMTTSADGVLVGVAGALVWCMLLAGVITRRGQFVWIAVIAAAALWREATAREYLQRLLWPLDGTWGYRLELTLDVVYLVLCAMFVRSAARRDTAPIPGARVYPAVAAMLAGCLLLAMLLPRGPARLPLPVAVGLFQALCCAFAAYMLVSAMLLARRARTALSPPLPRGASSTALLLGLSACFIAADGLIRTTGPRLETPLIPVSFILRSGSPVLAVLATMGNLSVLTLWAARQPGQSRRRRTLATGRPRALPPAAGAPDADRARPAGADVRPACAAAHTAPQAARAATTHGSTAAAPAVAPRILPARDADRQATILSYVGHDLRAPLAIISGYIRLLRQAAAPAQHAYLDVIERSIGHQFGLIDEVLAYSKSELQPFTLHPEEVDLPALLEELAHFGIALCAHQRNTFEYLPAPTLPARVWLDGKRLRQAVLNLLGNAAKFTTEGTVRLEARLRRHADRQAELELGVFNNGAHIAAEDQAGIFAAFRQLHRRESGLGLGLFIVERIANGMGGTVQLESSPERGNRFSLVIPITLIGPSVVATRPMGRTPAYAAAAPQLEAPPLAARLVLSRLARDGELSEIENWVVETRVLYPRYTGFYDEVAKCVETFDMECLQRLALQGTTGPAAEA
ncbi:hypothetical protein AKI39_03475 [Bordetella sp. H567]|uniref:7TM-DISM domain-containing protein n=1 Tax=Bordetella sp. H567 TaxID=1697043 RepID=UPI00081C92BD|nr:7TM-DISM domain-containing protein [Bordetella sp. H567]AOB29948.1 hypothetical protein AKI39_03475 [Bordetella sp. H567]